MLACRLGRESMVGMLVDVFGAELDYADKVKTPKQKDGMQKTRASTLHTFRGSEMLLLCLPLIRRRR